jgi:hypothetical protein
MAEDIKPEQVVRVQHRGRLLQIFLAPWTRAGKENAEPHLHVQEVGATSNVTGRILPVDSAEAQELRDWHPEVDSLVKGDQGSTSEEEQEAEAIPEQEASVS